MFVSERSDQTAPRWDLARGGKPQAERMNKNGHTPYEGDIPNQEDHSAGRSTTLTGDLEDHRQSLN
ncbi:MAG: hypothetical protein CMJ30_02135 [Phycisphaerae bacterium]|nr:hypothetical protein [Phycisphaerae bacterium]